MRRIEKQIAEDLTHYTGKEDIFESLVLLEKANNMPVCGDYSSSVQGIVPLAYDYIDMVNRYDVIQSSFVSDELKTQASVALEDAKIAVFLYVLEKGEEVLPPEIENALSKDNLAAYMAAYPFEATEVMCECAYNMRNNVNLVFDAKGKLLIGRSTGDKDIMQKVMDSFEDMKDKVFAEEEKVLSEHEGERE